MNNFENTLSNSKFKILKSFFYSNYYYLMLLLVTFICWLYGFIIPGMYLLLAFAMVSLIFNKDFTPVLPILPLMLMVVSNSSFLRVKRNITSIIVLGVIFAVCIIFNIIYYKQKLKKGELTISFFLVCIALFMGGIGSEYLVKYKDGLTFVLSLGPLMLGVYVAAISFMNIPRDVDAKVYLAKMIVLISSVCALQVLVSHLRLKVDFIDHFRALLDVGWTNRAGLVIMISFGLGPAFYMAERSKHFSFILYNFAFALYLALMFTCGRGGMLFGSLQLIAITIYILIKGKHRIKFLATVALWIIGLGIAIGLNMEFVREVIARLKDLGLNSSGRTSLFKEGWELFKQYPIFGVGFGYRGKHYFAPECIYWFHSTPIQVLASMGLLGAVCYGIYYIKRAKILLTSWNPFNIFMMMSLLTFEVHSLIDAGTFEPLPFLFTAVLINTFIEYMNRVELEDKISKYVVNVDGYRQIDIDKNEISCNDNCQVEPDATISVGTPIQADIEDNIID